ncbi:uncharacterized protein KY384_003125 [Bacidia gigantensis]|uniref:uncharacterized protein n=1 Tax=Bacidia gigantensis TaxID=2732470 RepID=UPI001D04AA4A|nr:uncharacterized protein KY384_003125 [Bacidia gigantensis]KAG8531496.1 hypothetical protein KY384_003125 [Bacidia gigantensis]
MGTQPKAHGLTTCDPMVATAPTKRRKLSPLNEDTNKTSNGVDATFQDDFVRSAARWNLEQAYEERPRKEKKSAKESSRLPIKTYDGKLQYLRELEKDEGVSDDAPSLVDGDEDVQAVEDARVTEQGASIPEWKQFSEAKAEMARIAIQINADPEENVAGFKRLAQIASSPNQKIKALALATQMAAYKDAIPGYRIKPHTDTIQKDKLSKDVRIRNTFEQSLVSSYQTYLQDLALCATGQLDPKASKSGLVKTAVSCASHLLIQKSHFNFRGELLKIIISELCKGRMDDIFQTCCKTLQTFFQDDENGTPSLEAVTMIAKAMRSRRYRVDESVLNVFLHLRLLSEFSSKASRDRVDSDVEDDSRGKKIRFKKEFRTKKTRKVMREQKKVEKDLKEADAIVDHEHRDRMQAETLKVVFGCYFRILKERVPSLMGAVLEGLAKYAHLINQDFFGDLLEALKDLINDASFSLEPKEDGELNEEPKSPDQKSQDSTRSILLCITTAFTLLEGQDASKSASSLGLDLDFFTQHLYRSLHFQSLNTDVELSAKTLRLPDPDIPNANAFTNNEDLKINFQTTIVLLLRALSSALTPRSTPPIRLAAFTKQLYTSSLHLPEKSTLVLLSLMDDVGKVHARKIGGLWNTEERKGDGVFDPFRKEVEGSNPFASTIWEGELLKCHFSPGVRERTRVVEKAVARI